MTGNVDGAGGQTISGNSGTVMIRQRSGGDLELGDLLVCESGGRSTLLQVCELETGSQMDSRTLEMVSGTMMGDGPGRVNFYEPETPNYTLATAKPLVATRGSRRGKPKSLIGAFTPVRRATHEDLSFMVGRGPGRLYMGQVRSGSKTIQGDGFWMDAKSAVSHHILVVASTGRGKSNFIKCMLWGLLGAGGVGMLVLDAHGEYYSGLSSHPRARDSLACYTSSSKPEPGAMSLTVNVRSVRPSDLRGVVELSDAQEQMMAKIYGKHQKLWIEHLERSLEDDPDGSDSREGLTRAVLYRKVMYALGMGRAGGSFSADAGAGEGTISDIMRRLDAGQVVVVDTSGLGVEEEQTIGNMLAGAVLHGRRRAKNDRRLDALPPAGVIVEEAPRLLADAGAGNAYSKIAREGRKFKVGLVAVTQLASVIPRDVLTNLSTKVIFGNEMHAERKAIIESAAQDLSEDSRNIASLDPGEAIISSVFAPFAVPVQVPLFDDLVRAGSRPAQKIKVVG